MHSSKQCFKCNKTLPITEFYAQRYMSDGHLNKCKECTKKDVKEYRTTHIDSIRTYEKRRSQLPHRIALSIAITKKWRNEDKRRMKCHNAVSRALRNGSLEWGACIVCGSDKSVAHHEDYDKPLDVMWLCDFHHKKRHIELRNQVDEIAATANLCTVSNI